MKLKFFASIVASLYIFWLLATPAIAAEQTREQPNVIVILADDLGYGDVGIYGNTVIETPSMDRMAREGIMLTNAYSSSSNCTPSRAGLLTGRYPVRTQMAHQVLFVKDTHGLPLEETTVAEMLKSDGYRTTIIGKWHLGHTEKFWPTNHGFDEYYGLPYSNNQSPLALYRDDIKIEEPVVQETLTKRYTVETVNFIQRNRDNPFFVYLAHTAPHVPLFASKRFKGHSKAGLYGDVVEELDWSVGQILNTLEELGLSENTLVIFTSDNGPYQGGNTAGLRGTKGTAWEGGYRVPFIARWPKHIPANQKNDGITMNIDILPTIQAVTGAKFPTDVVLDGKNLMPMFESASASPHDKLYLFADEQIAAIRTQRWKAVFRARYRGIHRLLPEHDVRLLFDMAADPNERYSQATRHEEVWRQMLADWAVGVSELESHALHLNQ